MKKRNTETIRLVKNSNKNVGNVVATNLNGDLKKTLSKKLGEELVLLSDHFVKISKMT